jgi:hypothetical protein
MDTIPSFCGRICNMGSAWTWLRCGISGPPFVSLLFLAAKFRLELELELGDSLLLLWNLKEVEI